MLKRKKILSILILILNVTLVAEGQNYYEFNRHPVSTNNYNEIAPVMTREGMVFMSDINTGSYTKWQDAEKNSFLHIYEVKKDEKGDWSGSELFSDKIKSHTDDGPVTFNFNEDFMAFSRNLEQAEVMNKRKVNPNMGIFFADFIEGEWTNIREFEHNQRESMTLFPSLDASGTVLYFSSDRPGGFGGYDLYVSRMKDNGWSEPENLGPVINSSKDEIYPFIHSSGRLYFSSSGHDNAADFDLFYTDFFNNRWFRPVKLPAPFNSSLNDFTFYATKDLDKGFFSSNRRGSTDIFEFESTLPAFEVCKRQVKNNYCYVFFEENTVLLDTAIYQYQWDMGDGAKITAIEAEHCFAGPGDYLVQLNVVDKLTDSVAFNQAEYLVEVRKVVQPYISIPDTVYVNQQLQLNGSESYFGDIEEGEYFWDFGDGNKAIGLRTHHTYLIPGSYQVKLGMISENEETETVNRFCSYKTIVVKEK